MDSMDNFSLTTTQWVILFSK